MTDRETSPPHAERLTGAGRLRHIALLPSLITVFNGLFGFVAIVLAGRGAEQGPAHLSCFALAGYVVLLAMLADMLDGKLARISRSTSSFGGQLDSLCDVISFGVAPALLMLRLTEKTLELRGAFDGSPWHRFVWVAALAYVSCAAIRLARFNVEQDENGAARMAFAGLPSPAAAGVVVSMVIFYQDRAPNTVGLVYALPFVTLAVAVLMVSRIRYPHPLNVYLSGQKPFAHLIQVLFFLGLVLWQMQTALLVIFTSYTGGGLIKRLWQETISRTNALAAGSTPTRQDSPKTGDMGR